MQTGAYNWGINSCREKGGINYERAEPNTEMSLDLQKEEGAIPAGLLENPSDFDRKDVYFGKRTEQGEIFSNSLGFQKEINSNSFYGLSKKESEKIEKICKQSDTLSSHNSEGGGERSSINKFEAKLTENTKKDPLFLATVKDISSEEINKTVGQKGGKLIAPFPLHYTRQKSICLPPKGLVSKDLKDIPCSNLLKSFETVGDKKNSNYDDGGPSLVNQAKPGVIYSFNPLANLTPKKDLISDYEEDFEVSISSPDVTPFEDHQQEFLSNSGEFSFGEVLYNIFGLEEEASTDTIRPTSDKLPQLEEEFNKKSSIPSPSDTSIPYVPPSLIRLVSHLLQPLILNENPFVECSWPQ